MADNASSDTAAVFQQLDNYNWDGDTEFQAALTSILKSASTPEQTAHLTTRARCYYYTRKYKTPVDFGAYQNWLQSQNNIGSGPESITPAQPQSVGNAPSSSHPSSMGEAPPPASFADICELIAQGKPIPGIKNIPDTILEGQGTRPQANQRKKPWEKDATPAPTPSWATRT